MTKVNDEMVFTTNHHNQCPLSLSRYEMMRREEGVFLAVVN